MPRANLGLACATAIACIGCAQRYAYDFQVTPTAVREDVVVKARVAPEAAVLLDLTNRTDQVLQVEWHEIALAYPDGAKVRLRPDADLGWVRPGETRSARLFPLVVPRTGTAARRNDNQRFQLHIPVVVHREPDVLQLTLTARVREI